MRYLFCIFAGRMQEEYDLRKCPKNVDHRRLFFSQLLTSRSLLLFVF
uniref:Uncharacterized protein n=1 Tax=Arundo donax TaxID=35708 RepID=A0A0A9G8F1_ARUDO